MRLPAPQNMRCVFGTKLRFSGLITLSQNALTILAICTKHGLDILLPQHTEPICRKGNDNNQTSHSRQLLSSSGKRRRASEATITPQAVIRMWSERCTPEDARCWKLLQSPACLEASERAQDMGSGCCPRISSASMARPLPMRPRQLQ